MSPYYKFRSEIVATRIRSDHFLKSIERVLLDQEKVYWESVVGSSNILDQEKVYWESVVGSSNITF